MGPCAAHTNNSAVAKCQRCGKMMCALCRTRWDEEMVCAHCLDDSLHHGAANPRQVQMQNRQANLSVVFAFMGWSVLALSMSVSRLLASADDSARASFSKTYAS